MSKILLETVNLKKTYDHKNGTINLFDNVNIKIKTNPLIQSTFTAVSDFVLTQYWSRELEPHYNDVSEMAR